MAMGLTSMVGCATSESDVPVIYSRAAPTPIARAYLIVFQGRGDLDRTEKLRQALTDALQPRTSALVSMLVTGTQLDEPTARADIKAFAPDGIVMVKPAHEDASGDSTTYDVAVEAPKEKRTVWHASLVSQSGPEVMARDLVEHLTTAGVLAREASREPPPSGKKPANLR
jgi:hypothetical protein